ncbi:hypothetical protein Hdeb2414_s0012g00377051 [Helianthus debilis subsp. tardiflorus]
MFFKIITGTTGLLTAPIPARMGSGVVTLSDLYWLQDIELVLHPKLPLQIRIAQLVSEYLQATLEDHCFRCMRLYSKQLCPKNYMPSRSFPSKFPIECDSI